MKLIPCNVQPIIERAIANPVNSLDFAEDMYLRAKELEEAQGHRWDWPSLDRAIVARFGAAALEQIQAGLLAGV